MRILVINGPNMNLLGLREPDIYGVQTYEALVQRVRTYCAARGAQVRFVQSNHEGALVDAIQSAYGTADAIVINAAAYTHTSIALLDALRAVALPAVEVHMSDVDAREPFRRISYVGMACQKRIVGRGIDGYLEAVQYLLDRPARP